MRISVVTPCYNAERYIAETVASVVSQRAVLDGRVELEYLVCDGASSDGTVARALETGGDRVRLTSEPDRGMYDALAKGLSHVSGDVVAYLNAGDAYHPHAFDVLLDVFSRPERKWITGYSVVYADRGFVSDVVLPYRYRRDLLRSASYDGHRLPFVQQETTFWRTELHRTVDWDQLARFRLAGDAYLWSCFASEAELHVVQAYLGGFRRHPGQLSSDRTAYQRELRTIAPAPSSVERVRAAVDRILWRAPAGLKRRLNPTLLSYDHEQRLWS